jgi:hypothetical protein
MKRALTAFVVGMLWSGFVLGSSMCGVVGSWFVAGGATPSDLVVVTAMRDGRFFLVDASPPDPADPAGFPGFERGTFTINPANKQLNVAITKDMNGNWGASHAGALTASANGNTLVVTSAEGPSTFTRARNPASPIVGSWLHESGDSIAVVTFLTDGTYVVAQDGAAAGGGTPGIERGTYTWNAQTGAFTATTTLDTNEQWGFSHSVPAFITVVGARMTVSDDPTAVFTRVRSGPACQRKDNDGDGKADLLWRHTGGVGATGETYIYPMDGLTIKPNEGFSRTVSDLDWRIEARGDFNGDGMADILWRHYGTGANYIYLMNGTAIIGEGFIRTVADLSWRVERINDFNGDRKDDILWYNFVTGETYIYPMDGLIILPSEGFIRTVPDLNWRVELAADFDGNGMADILWRHGVTGQNYIWTMDGTTVTANEGFIRTVADLNWDVQSSGDYGGDGFADIVWRHLVTGENYIYFMRGTTIQNEGFIRTVPDQNWLISEVGDFDGDGKSDIVWRHRLTGENYIYFMDGLTIKPSESFIRTVADPLWTISPAPLHEAVLRINEVNANIANQCDLVELRVVLGGRMGNMTLRRNTNIFHRFSAFNVAKNDIIVVHLNPANCNATGAGNEASGTAQFRLAQHPSNYDTAFDWWASVTTNGLSETDVVLTLSGRTGNIIDAVALTDNTTTALQTATQAQIGLVSGLGTWQQVGGGIPPGGFVGQTYVDHAVADLNATGTVASGLSIQRINNGDTNTKADWTAAPAASSFGVLNAGQTPF